MRAKAGPDQAQGPPPPLPSGDDGQVRGRDTADLFHFFNQAAAAPPLLASQVRHTSDPVPALMLTPDAQHRRRGEASRIASC